MPTYPDPRLELALPETVECHCDHLMSLDCACFDITGDEPEEREDDDAYDRWRDRFADGGRE